MASGSSNLSTRMFPEHQKILMYEIALKHFKEHKVEISDAIKHSFPFFETLHDRGLITKKVYKEAQKSCENRSLVPKVVYEVINKLEEKNHLLFLKILFSSVIMKNYDELKGIAERLEKEILKKICHQANAGGESAQNPSTQLSLEQGTGANPYQILSWLFHDPSNDTVIKDETIPKRVNRKEPPGASTSAQKRKAESITSRKSPTSGNKLPKKVRISEGPSGLGAEEQRPGAGSPAVGSGADVAGPVDLGKNPALQKPKRRRRIKQQLRVPVNFSAEILSVTCGEVEGKLIKRKLEQGATRKCVRTEDGNWYTPREFEVRGGYGKSSHWKTSLTCGENTLKELMENKMLLTPRKEIDRKKKEGSSDKCEICQDGGKVFNCETCRSFFHEDCHIPPVDTKRSGWICTFCIMQNYSRSLQRYKEPEVFMKLMGPEEKLKCQYLLLKIYGPLESAVFLKIPHANYVKEATQCLRKLRILDRIKKKLIKENFRTVGDFVKDMEKCFSTPGCQYLRKEDYTKNFKAVFAIQETNQNSSLV